MFAEHGARVFQTLTWRALQEQKRSNSANVIFRTALGIQVALEARSLGPGWSPLTWPFLLASVKITEDRMRLIRKPRRECRSCDWSAAKGWRRNDLWASRRPTTQI